MDNDKELELEPAGFTRQMVLWNNLDDLLDGCTIAEVIDSINCLKSIFGENFEKLEELKIKYEGGNKQYFKELRKGKCRCGSCDDIYEWWICTRR